MMKKTGFIIGLFATAFGIAVVNKMQKINANKDSVKGKAKELAGDVVGNEKLQAEGTVDQVVGASKEVLEDLKESVSSVFSSGATDKVAGKAKEVTGEVTGDKKQEVEGLIDQATGDTKKVADKAKDKAENVVEDAKEKLDK
ncbi:CsbD family protein [Enterococcus faecalis]|uniref:CsbD family protein n=1 Tax=Enterococcus faecalis TaxID=1351 RepID=UPI00032E42AA|nr:CsbD family protein [Enterococcus faecalis]EGO2635460.1 CsbD family protein [Enterococcus faecalis]EGO8962755.1 CsbD family protein [Enterococcus faecalis]EGO9273809.1 CsbD family protein [Enterococcus faecalis]EGS8307569.1 CsbD family protein [Enterococcus faecalis]EHH1618230.1 CsbD family protein [Enterococcus faecalis]